MRTRTFTLALFAAVTIVAWAGSAYAQSYPPPPPPYSQGPGGYSQAAPGYDDQAPYYDPRPDGNYDDPNSYDQGYDSSYDSQSPADESLFYSELSPYGRWIQRGSYGWVWEPTRVEVGWRPYTRGRWVQSDYGWTWLSDEPWGWATYHYGRWTLDREYGWLWVPGTDWGPAWVSFQEGNGYLGWAPLPPSVGFQASIGIQIGGLSLSASIDPYAWSFVPERSFFAARLDSVILPPARNVTFIRSTTNYTNIRVVNHRVFNQGFPTQRIEQATGQRVQHFQLTPTRDRARGRVAQVQGNQISIFQPAPSLARPQANVTPQVAIQRRQQQQLRRGAQQSGQPQPGQPQPGQPTRQVQQPPQPGDQRQWQRPSNTRPAPSPEEVDRKYQAQQQQLQARQEAQRNRLQQLQQQEQQNRGNNAQAQQREAQRQAEQKALQEQNQREQQLLQARRDREKQAAQARPQRPPNDQNQQNRQNQQNQNQQQQRQKEQPQRERKPEPTPPPV
ncbi:MAG: DUF6600 domain-containing protein [Thermoanaerobaculia bacterium]